MNFETYLSQAWEKHANHPENVAKEFAHGLTLIESNEQLVPMTGILTHVMGEHLGQWDEGIRLLQDFKKHPKYVGGSESEKAIHRSLEVLTLAKGQSENLENFSRSDQIRIMAIAASAISGRDSARALGLLGMALELAASGLEKQDPANRALAVTGNNLACALEEKKNRSFGEVELMIFSAGLARKYWEVAGTWLEVSRAEYRLAMTFLQAEDLDKALIHAQICIKMCEENKALPMDMFYSYESLALVEKAKKNEVGFRRAAEIAKAHYENINPENKKWCESSLQKLL